METILTNARLVTEGGVFPGTLVFDARGIRAVEEGRSHAPGAIDAEGDLLAPGLIECHTDNLERHFLPRPHVIWPNAMGAALGHDAQMAAAGVTTVYDAISTGFFDSSKAYRRELFHRMVEAIGEGRRDDLFRIEHKIHLRCELSDPGLIGDLETHLDNPLVELASLMDHTPGQRQWRDPEQLKTFIRAMGHSSETVDAILEERMERAKGAVQTNWPATVSLLRQRGIRLASHDDTTPDHVAEAVEAGCSISEFPTTLEAARAAKDAGLATVAGAPNVVRGGSHSGGVSARELAGERLLDALSSEYAPASLLEAVGALTEDSGLPLPEAIGLVTWRPADMLGLFDRGRLAPGLRADLVQFRFAGKTPVVRQLIRGGERVL